MSGKKINILGPGFKILLISAILLLMAPGCQRDDICSAATQTTPMLLISFFNTGDTIPKPATNLLVRELSFDTIIYNRESAAEIRIPLRVDSGTTEYEFILNAPAEGSPDESSTARLTFSYDPEEIYISRACSFKVNFRNLTADFSPENNAWISSITVVEEIIENETSAHVYIYH